MKLAIALMKDADGVIDIDLPITGSLDDPEFSVASLVLDAFINIITKIVASPFQAIASLTGSDEDLSIVKFESGSPELTEVEINKLINLTKALSERPRLSLEIKGAAYQVQDWPAMQQGALLDQLKQRKADQLKEEGQIELAENIQLSDDEYKELLADLFIEKFPELGERSLFGTPKLIPEEMGDFYEVAGKKLAAIIPPDQHKLFILAATRARNIARYLIQQGGIADGRIFVLDAKTDINAPETGISTELSLNVS